MGSGRPITPRLTLVPEALRGFSTLRFSPCCPSWLGTPLRQLTLHLDDKKKPSSYFLVNKSWERDWRDLLPHDVNKMQRELSTVIARSSKICKSEGFYAALATYRVLLELKSLYTRAGRLIGDLKCNRRALLSFSCSRTIRKDEYRHIRYWCLDCSKQYLWPGHYESVDWDANIPKHSLQYSRFLWN